MWRQRRKKSAKFPTSSARRRSGGRWSHTRCVGQMTQEGGGVDGGGGDGFNFCRLDADGVTFHGISFPIFFCQLFFAIVCCPVVLLVLVVKSVVSSSTTSAI